MAAASKAAARRSTTRPTTEPPPTQPPEPHLLHFGLRQFLAFVSGIAALLGAMAFVGRGWAPAIGFFAALVAAHVLATLVGTRLRESSAQRHAWRPGHLEMPPGAPAKWNETAAAPAILPESSLARHESSPLRSAVAAVIGLLVGGAGGAAGIPVIAGPQATAAGIALGAVSCGVIAAWLALLVANFWTIARGAWREAHAAASPATAAGQRRPFWRRRDTAA